ncbi:ankyrin repeat domain-containing protein [Paenibacillus sp. N3.4]|uniref:ankyrin repeat domain-containing protein n=1 Tax=Paenibacillus sp. N3.4 TaxID=2603222 RepID=UPI00164F6336|nr:ankyrin repeat domain-containing protein [Paenibacillus sp. N3.4]
MKKFIAGLVCGLSIGLCTVAFASETIQAYLFSGHIKINGQEKTLSHGANILNVEGTTYVPIRYVSENLGINVGYDEQTKTIDLAYGKMNLQDPKELSLVFGDIVDTPNVVFDNSDIDGHIMINATTPTYVSATFAFMDDNGKMIGEGTIWENFDPGLQKFHFHIQKNVSRYSTISVQVHDVHPSVNKIVKDLYTFAKMGDGQQIQALLSSVPAASMGYVLIDFMKIAHMYGSEDRSFLLRYLLETHVDVNTQDKETGYTALMYASEFAYDLISPLVDAGADVKIINKSGSTALHAIASKNKPDIVKLYLDHGADPNGGVLIAASRPTFLIYSDDTIKTMQLLLKANANVNEIDSTGMTALKYLETYKDMEMGTVKQVYELLITYGAR